MRLRVTNLPSTRHLDRTDLPHPGPAETQRKQECGESRHFWNRSSSKNHRHVPGTRSGLKSLSSAYGLEKVWKKSRLRSSSCSVARSRRIAARASKICFPTSCDSSICNLCRSQCSSSACLPTRSRHFSHFWSSLFTSFSHSS